MLDYVEYIMTWAVYLVAAVGLMAVWWRLTRFIPWQTPKQVLRVVLAALILMPAPVIYGSADWAPALFVLLLEVTVAKEADTMRAVPFLLYGLILGLLALFADGLFRYWRNKKAAF